MHRLLPQRRVEGSSFRVEFLRGRPLEHLGGMSSRPFAQVDPLSTSCRQSQCTEGGGKFWRTLAFRLAPETTPRLRRRYDRKLSGSRDENWHKEPGFSK